MPVTNPQNKFIKEGLAFDDVLLVPARSEILPADADISTRLSRNITLRVPLMLMTADASEAIAIAQAGGMALIEESEGQSDAIKQVKDTGLLCGAIISDTPDILEQVKVLIDAHVDMLVLDAPHGHHTSAADRVHTIKGEYPQAFLMAGGVVTQKGAEALIAAGADALKVGICPLIIPETGVGMPSVTAIYNVSCIAASQSVSVLAHSPVKQSGDVVKALAAGANAVLLNPLLNGNENTMTEIAAQIAGGLRTTMSYCGCGNLKAFHKKSQFITK